MPNKGAKLKELRESRAWSQEQLAAIANLSVRTIQRIENSEPASFETLKSLAAAFDLNVADFTAPEKDKPTAEGRGKFLLRVTSGTELFGFTYGAHAADFGNDEPQNEAEIELLGRFFDGLKNWGDILDDIYPSQRIRLEDEYRSLIEELDEMGFWVFAGIDKKKIKIGGNSTDWRMSVIRVIRKTNPTIIKVNPDTASVYQEVNE